MLKIANVLIITVFLLGVRAHAAYHYLMGAIGDSITVAFMADTSVSPGTRFSVPQRSLTNPEIEEAYKKLNEMQKMSSDNRYTLSWATGSEIKSQAVLLTDYFKRAEPDATVEVRNVAVTGALTGDLLSQADEMVAAAKETSRNGTPSFDSVKYITLLIGANDACHDVSDTDMKNNLMAIFEKLNKIEQAEPVRIMMSGIPKIPDLGFPEIGSSTGFGGLSCDTIRNNFTKTCLSLAIWNSAAEYETKVAYVANKNAVLKAAADAANTKFSHLEIVFDDSIFNRKITPGDLAAECFHPNAKAQETISVSLWPSQPWYH